MSTQTGDLDWPDGFDRTPAGEREPYPGGFQVSRKRAFDSILEELEKLEARNVQVETAAPHSAKNPHVPYKDREPDDPGVVVYFERHGQQRAVPCDRWSNLRDNARAIALYLEAKRALERYGVQTVEGEFQTQALPPGNEDDVIVADDGESQEPHEVLEVAPDASTDVVRAAARRKLANTHPDSGDDDAEYKRIQKARDKMLAKAQQ